MQTNDENGCEALLGEPRQELMISVDSSSPSYMHGIVCSLDVLLEEYSPTPSQPPRSSPS